MEAAEPPKQCIKRIVFLDFIHRLVSQKQTKLKKLKIIDKRLKPK
jgi:hypothetical protein